MDLDSALDPAQRAAVTSAAPRLLILASAGSGKTTTLTHRAARLIEAGVPPPSIVLVTFTRRAARQMMDRLEARLGARAHQVQLNTFHGLAYRLVQAHADVMGLPPRLSVSSRDRQLQLMTDAAAGMRGVPSPRALVEIGALAINRQQTIASTIAEFYPTFTPKLPAIQSAFDAYAGRKAEAEEVDFDDLLLFLKALLLRSDARAVTGPLRHVFVDEYQDTTNLQAEIAQLLCRDGAHLCVVGDDAQAIYRFRGADVDNILDFPNAAPTQIHTLDVTYRCQPHIANAARATLRPNRLRPAPALRSSRPPGAPVVVVTARDEAEQAAFVAQRVIELHRLGMPLERIAVLYRTHRAARPLELELSRRRVPHQVRTGHRLSEDPSGVPALEPDAEAVEPGAPALTLTTVHQAKGLEWAAVFVIGLFEGSFPARQALDESGGEQEERRLFHVAITRAEDELYLCHPEATGPADGEGRGAVPSRYLSELPADGVERWRLSP